MIDLAVPRDIEPEVAQLEDVFLYTIDDLGRLVEAGRDTRLQAAREAETFIRSEVDLFATWLKSRAIVPVIREFRAHVEAYRLAELERARRALQHGASTEEVLLQLSQGLTNKILHHPTHLLTVTEGEEQAELMKWLPRLFPTLDPE
jgi:glutamyl-tRNA reductase